MHLTYPRRPILVWIQLGDDINSEGSTDRSEASLSLSTDNLVICSPENSYNASHSSLVRVIAVDLMCPSIIGFIDDEEFVVATVRRCLHRLHLDAEVGEWNMS